MNNVIVISGWFTFYTAVISFSTAFAFLPVSPKTPGPFSVLSESAGLDYVRRSWNA
jgi:hypothetical protein